MTGKPVSSYEWGGGSKFHEVHYEPRLCLSLPNGPAAQLGNNGKRVLDVDFYSDRISAA